MKLFAVAVTATADTGNACPVGEEHSLMVLIWAASIEPTIDLAQRALAQHRWIDARLDGDVQAVIVSADQIGDATTRRAAHAAMEQGAAIIVY